VLTGTGSDASLSEAAGLGSLWDQALTQASAYLAELLTRADRDTLLNDVFDRAGTDATVFEANKQDLLEAIGTTGLRNAIDLCNTTEMESANGAYAQEGPNGHERIYFNADWINAGNLSLEQLTAMVLEEFGSALDVRLNADQIAAINPQDDWGTVQVDGQLQCLWLHVDIVDRSNRYLHLGWINGQ
jgi:hypothetical protein